MTTCYVITDSYGVPTPNFATVMCARLSWTLTIDAIGGTGYLNGSPTTNFRARIPAALATHPDIVMIMGSVNDTIDTPANVATEALRCWAALTTVPIIYAAFLCVSDSGSYGPTIMTPYATVLSMAAPPNVFFINGVGWINTKNAIAYEAADRQHPMVTGGVGAKYLGTRLAFVIRPPSTGLI